MAELRLDTAVQNADLVILALLIQFVLLVVFDESVTGTDARRDDLRERVLGFPGRFQALVVLLDGLERVELLLNGRHRGHFRLIAVDVDDDGLDRV